MPIHLGNPGLYLSWTRARGGRHVSNDIPAQAVSVEEAARRLGLTPDAIRKRIRRGQLETRKVNHA